MQLLNIYSKNILSQFIPMNIQEDIIINLKNNIEYSVTLDNININFSFFYKDSLESNKILIIFVKALYLIKLFGFKNAKINIMCFLSNIKKEFSNEKFLGSNEVNSGLTSFDINGNNIIIYRLEEIEKVVLHELVHSLEIDNKVMNNLDKIHDLIKCNFSINNDSSINFFESFTESIAFITNIISNSILSNSNYKELIKNEIKFCIFQCCKIMKFYNINIKMLFSVENCVKKQKYMVEKTSILSYYFLKLGSILNINLFINKFIFKKKINIESYYNFIKENLSKIDFFNIDAIDKSLRMTLYDFLWEFK